MFNLLKHYNELLEVDAMTEPERRQSLRGVFNRDIQDNPDFKFRQMNVSPTPAEGMDKMDNLFLHLTTKMADPLTRHREYDRARAIRLHWILFHLREHKKDDMLIFSTVNGRERRTYIYDRTEQYVIVLEPKDRKREGAEPVHYYFLLTAYKLEGKDKARNKIERLYQKRTDCLL